MMPRLRNRRRLGQRGVAALEFALVCPLLLTFFGGVADLGLAVWSQSCLANAVAQGAEYAYRKAQTGTTLTSSQIATYVQTVSTLSGVTATSTTTPGYYCMNVSTSPATLVSSTSGATCTAPTYDGGKAGLYVHIIANYAYPAMMPLYSTLVNTTITESTWVRLQ
jgi:Flp pilus assembly protein TadG